MSNTYKWKLIAYCLGLALLGVFLLYISNIYISDAIFKDIGKSVSISVITASFFTVVINFFQRNYFEEKLSALLEKKVPFMNRLSKVGIVNFERSFPLQSDEFEAPFINSKEVTLVFNDGKRFYQNNITLFRKRFAQKGKKTKFVFMNPETQDSISVLTRKNGHEGDYYKNKIAQFIENLKKERDDYDHEIEIYIHDLFTTMSVIQTDSYAMFSLYRISPGQETVPHITVEKNNSELCEYNKISKDVKKLIERSKKA